MTSMLSCVRSKSFSPGSEGSPIARQGSMKDGGGVSPPGGSPISQAAFSKAARGQILQHVELSSASRSGHSTTGTTSPCRVKTTAHIATLNKSCERHVCHSQSLCLQGQGNVKVTSAQVCPGSVKNKLFGWCCSLELLLKLSEGITAGALVKPLFETLALQPRLLCVETWCSMAYTKW